MNLVATVSITNDNGEPKWATESLHTIRNYAERIGADCLVVDHSPELERGGFPSTFYAKLHAYEHPGDWDRILYVDADVMIAKDAPDIFEEHTPSFVWARKDLLATQQHFIRWAEKECGVVIPQKFVHHNAGVLVMDRPDAESIADYTRQNLTSAYGADQHNLNMWSAGNPGRVQTMDTKWNYFGTPKNNPDAYFYHFVSSALKPHIEKWAQHERFAWK